MRYFEELKKKADGGDAKSQFYWAAWCKDPEAVKYFKLASDQGYPPAQAEYGRYLFNGDFVEQDVKEAIRLWRIAAKTGEADAQRLLGASYIQGRGVRKNYAKAFELLNLALKNGSKDALYYIACLYYDGLGIEKDEAKAIRMFRKSANAYQDLLAMVKLYEIYWNDAKDYEESIKWMKKAAEYRNDFFGTDRDGDLGARKLLAELYSYGRLGEYTTIPNTQLAIKYLKLAVSQEDEESMLLLAQTYRNGLKPKYKEAIRLLNDLVEKGSLPAKVDLGTFYYFGLGVKKNPKKAFELFSENLSKDYPLSYYYLGCCYEFGVGVEIDKKKAFKLFLVAAKAGIPEAQYNVGVTYYWADVVRKDLDKMFYWLTLSAQGGYVLGESNLAECYEKGYGTPVDIEKAIYWYENAAMQGNQEASEALERLRTQEK